MKKIILIATVSFVLLAACNTSKLATNSDDMYVGPAAERKEQQRLAAKLKKQQEEEARKKQNELAEQKAKEDNNPYYKEPEYNKDDYYDYQYASRLRRFNNNVPGLGYYDNYYTNSYWYNNNPNMYGTSIYNSYSWWGNSPYFGNNWYPYGYNNYYGHNNWTFCSGSFYSYYPYNQNYLYGNNWGWGSVYYYNPWFGNSFNNNNGWGYFNSFDSNSKYSKMTNAARGSNGGGNSTMTSSAGKPDGFMMKYMDEVKQQQDNSPKFTDISKPFKGTGTEPGLNGNYNSNNNTGNFAKPNLAQPNTGANASDPANVNTNNFFKNTAVQGGGTSNPSVVTPTKTTQDPVVNPNSVKPAQPANTPRTYSESAPVKTGGFANPVNGGNSGPVRINGGSSGSSSGGNKGGGTYKPR